MIEKEKEEISKQVADLQAKCEMIERTAREKREQLQKKREEELNSLRKKNNQYKAELERKLQPKK